MSQEFGRIGIDRLLTWILKEYAEGEIFGISKDLFFDPANHRKISMQRYGLAIESPIGVAAGPHTQMAQNIISAWLCGARYLELKTVQTLDELNVSKPCIDMSDEGYNCEWSQELRLDDSFDEYLNAWILLHLLRHNFGWSDDRGNGFIFNMSVGYNMEGILNPNVQRFLDRMSDCSKELREKIDTLRPLYPAIDAISIPARLSDNVTLSTMHGCPPGEIEKIGTYLIRDRKYHTTIKLNPTLLGPAHLRNILNDRLGYETIVPDEAFGHDLKYSDALTIIKNLTKAADEEGVAFSIKLTNTLECVNIRQVFPPNEKMMYMSGRALHPISINLASKLQNDFDGSLDITFSAGIDCFNLAKVIACGIRPVTVSSDILKPGGYGRMKQYIDNLANAIVSERAHDLDSFALAFSKQKDLKTARLVNLRRYAGSVTDMPDFHKDSKYGESVKTNRELTVFDCIQAPCVNTCPVHQDIPAYMYYTSKGDFHNAMKVIRHANPFPNVLGMVCDHQCQHKCTRSNYDSPLLIREIKRFVAEHEGTSCKVTAGAKNGKKTAVIGAGPSGLACAYFLTLDGFDVTVFETKAFAGGMVSDAIPAFRLSAEAIEKDIEFIRSLGVTIKCSYPVNRQVFERLRREYDFVYVAVGAQAAKKMNIPGEDCEGVIDCLNFLSILRSGAGITDMKKVIVVGGGNSAIDAARAASRLVGAAGKVTLVYRRTRKEMPADPEEVKALLEEKIQILELTAPDEVIVKNDHVVGLRCQQMRLGEKDSSGRARPEKIPGAFVEIACDTIIPAIGQDPAVDFTDLSELKPDLKTGMTRLQNVFAGGDIVRGASTIIKAVGDGRIAAESIREAAGTALNDRSYLCKKGFSLSEFQTRNSRKIRGKALNEVRPDRRRGFEMVLHTMNGDDAVEEAKRCLFCSDFCNVCVTVCPNRANRYYKVTPQVYNVQKAVRDGDGCQFKNIAVLSISQEIQTLNIGDFCNECGNCTTFCPTAGAPFKDKPKFYLAESSFEKESNGYYLKGDRLAAKKDGRTCHLEEKDGTLSFLSDDINVKFDPKTLEAISANFTCQKQEISLDFALQMGILYKALKGACFTQ